MVAIRAGEATPNPDLGWVFELSLPAERGGAADAIEPPADDAGRACDDRRLRRAVSRSGGARSIAAGEDGGAGAAVPPVVAENSAGGRVGVGGEVCKHARRAADHRPASGTRTRVARAGLRVNGITCSLIAAKLIRDGIPGRKNSDEEMFGFGRLR